MTVFCRDCDHVVSATRSQDWWRWRCLRAPTPLANNFVDPPAVPTPPYERCDRKNHDGRCPDFSPRREPAQ